MTDTTSLTTAELITTPFTFHSTADEVAAGVDLTGKHAIVTGAASGIGVETARVLAQAGADVTLAVRNLEAGHRVAAGIRTSTGNADVRVAELDVADLSSVARFASEWSTPLHILVNNAGIMATPESYTPAGVELQFATNHLGHFALALGLHDALRAAHGARIVVVSSSGHLLSPVVFDDVDFDFRPYDPLLAYGQSKTAAILFAVEAAARWAADGITANALMPGAIGTNLQRHTGGLKTPVERQKTVQQGASTSVLLAASPLIEGVTGRYFEDNAEARVVQRGDGWSSGVAPYALDAANARRLWEMSLGLLGGVRMPGSASR